MKSDEAMVGIRCDSCEFTAVILSEMDDTDCPECATGTLVETSVLAAED